MRYGCLAAFVLLVIVPLASIAQAGADKPAVSVTVLEDTPDHVVLHYAIGAFTETAVSINGQEYMQIGLGTESQILECGAPDLPNICRSVIVGDDAALNLSVVSAESYELKDIAVAPSKGNLYRNVDPATIPYVFGPRTRLTRTTPAGWLRWAHPTFCGTIAASWCGSIRSSTTPSPARCASTPS